VQQRLSAAGRHLSIDASEELVVLGTIRSDVDHGEAALVLTGRHDPVLVRRNEEAHEVLEPDRVETLGLDHLRLGCDQSLEPALGGLVAGPEAFVCLEE
jgi:hypothetical protein